MGRGRNLIQAANLATSLQDARPDPFSSVVGVTRGSDRPDVVEPEERKEPEAKEDPNTSPLRGVRLGGPMQGLPSLAAQHQTFHNVAHAMQVSSKAIKGVDSFNKKMEENSIKTIMKTEHLKKDILKEDSCVHCGISGYDTFGGACRHCSSAYYRHKR